MNNLPRYVLRIRCHQHLAEFGGEFIHVDRTLYHWTRNLRWTPDSSQLCSSVFVCGCQVERMWTTRIDISSTRPGQESIIPSLLALWGKTFICAPFAPNILKLVVVVKCCTVGYNVFLQSAVVNKHRHHTFPCTLWSNKCSVIWMNTSLPNIYISHLNFIL